MSWAGLMAVSPVGEEMQESRPPTRYRVHANDLLEICPPQPQSVADTGLPYPLLQDLVLRRLFVSGHVSGIDLGHALHLPYSGVVETVLQGLVRLQWVDFTGGPGFGRPYFDYLLTDKGRERARDAFERCAYVGPAPVPLAVYAALVYKQIREVAHVGKRDLEKAFHDMVMEHSFLERLGPAINSVRSLFLYGAPGNGKTSIAERIAGVLKGEIFVPFAVEVDSQIIQVFDLLVHRPVPPLPDANDPEVVVDPDPDDGEEDDINLPTLHEAQIPHPDDADGGRTVEMRFPNLVFREEDTAGKGARIIELGNVDERWALCYRPRVIVGGELTLENLDLTYSPQGRYYEAPVQIKACQGMLLVDDFGRQKVHPTDLLNRWIVPLEKRVDFLTLQTGKKFEVPFETLVIFSTNLDPSKLVDEAFLRRIRYKLEVGDPSERVYRHIFRREAERQNIRFDRTVLDYIVQTYYRKERRPLRGCHPRDILQLVGDHARYLRVQPAMTRRLVDQSCRSYFVHMEGDTQAKEELTSKFQVESLLNQ